MIVADPLKLTFHHASSSCLAWLALECPHPLVLMSIALAAKGSNTNDTNIVVNATKVSGVATIVKALGVVIDDKLAWLTDVVGSSGGSFSC